MRAATVVLAAGLAVVLAAATPVDALSFRGQTDFPSFDKLRLTLTLTFEGENATQTRTYLDEDEDGSVSEEEAKQLESVWEQGTTDRALEESTWGGKNPSSFEDQDIEYAGVVGPVDSEAPIVLTVVEIAVFEGVGKEDTMVLKLGDEADDGGDEEGDDDVDAEVSFKAPRGYTIDSYDASTDGQLSGDRKTLTFVNPSGAAGVTITFKAGGGGFASGVPTTILLVALVGLGFGMVAARRR